MAAAADSLSTCFVDLTRARGAGDVRQAVADCFGVGGQDLTEALREAQVLLILDNAEHVRDALIDTIPTLLAGEGGVWLLVTSRMPLGLRDEHALWLDALSADPPDQPAVRLLADRAGLSTEERKAQLPDLVTLARRADGVPLALELLAANLRWESAADLRSRLDAELPDLEDDARDRPARHVSVRSAISWNLGQAGADARAALGALTTFRASFELPAATAVLEAVLPAHTVRAALKELVDLSLLQRSPAGGAIRFHVLEPIRLCALASDLVPEPSYAAHQAHAAHYLPWLTGTGRDSRRSRVDRPSTRRRRVHSRARSEPAHRAGMVVEGGPRSGPRGDTTADGRSLRTTGRKRPSRWATRARPHLSARSAGRWGCGRAGRWAAGRWGGRRRAGRGRAGGGRAGGGRAVGRPAVGRPGSDPSDPNHATRTSAPHPAPPRPAQEVPNKSQIALQSSLSGGAGQRSRR